MKSPLTSYGAPSSEVNDVQREHLNSLLTFYGAPLSEVNDVHSEQ